MLSMKSIIKYRVMELIKANDVKMKASNGIFPLKIRNIRNIEIVSSKNAVLFFIRCPFLCLL